MTGLWGVSMVATSVKDGREERATEFRGLEKITTNSLSLLCQLSHFSFIHQNTLPLFKSSSSSKTFLFASIISLAAQDFTHFEPPKSLRVQATLLNMATENNIIGLRAQIAGKNITL
jgi:hypothetical protein